MLPLTEYGTKFDSFGQRFAEIIPKEFHSTFFRISL